MSEKMFTQEEVEKTIDLMLLIGDPGIGRDEIHEKLDGISIELKEIIARKLTMFFISIMMNKHKCGNPFEELREVLSKMPRAYPREEKCACEENSHKERISVKIYKNGKPVTVEDKSELLDLLKKMTGES